MDNTETRKWHSDSKHELIALVRFSQFMLHEGAHAGAKSLWRERGEPIPKPPSQVAFIEPDEYSQLVSGNVTTRDLDILRRFFQTEVSTDLWGRILFYIIEGNQSFEFDTFPEEEKVPLALELNSEGMPILKVLNDGETQRERSVEPVKIQVRLSRLPRMFYPDHCIAPGCTESLPLKRPHQKNSPHPRYLCDGCPYEYRWSSIQKKIRTAFDCVYRQRVENEILDELRELNRLSKGEGITPETAFQLIWEGYVELCRFIGTPVGQCTEQLSESATCKLVFLDDEIDDEIDDETMLDFGPHGQNDNRKKYTPIACSSLEPFGDCLQLRELLRLLCQLPHEIPEVEEPSPLPKELGEQSPANSAKIRTKPKRSATPVLIKSGSGFGDSHIESTFIASQPMWRATFAEKLSPISLPKDAFKDESIKIPKTDTKTNTNTDSEWGYKFISRFKDDKNNPLNWNFQPDPDNFILLENLDGCLDE